MCGEGGSDSKNRKAFWKEHAHRSDRKGSLPKTLRIPLGNKVGFVNGELGDSLDHLIGFKEVVESS